MVERPYLSIVAATRNDNHGGDLNRRSEIFIKGVVAQAIRFQLPTELILVEWNPPDDRPPLREAFNWPESNPWCEIRIITVPPSVHRRYRYSDRLPMFQMIAKNVGVRRARGDFILQTNVDILFSDELFEFLAKRRLLPGVLYRCDRIDVDRDVPLGAGLDEQLAYCRTNVLRIARRNGMWVVPPGAPSRTANHAILVPYRDPLWDLRRNGLRERIRRSANHFKFAFAEWQRTGVVARIRRRWANNWRNLRRFIETSRDDLKTGTTRVREIAFDSLEAALLGFRWLIAFIGRVVLWLPLSLLVLPLLMLRRLCRPILRWLRRSSFVRFWASDLPAAMTRLRFQGFEPTLGELLDELQTVTRKVPALHSNACGDFILTDAASWQAMRGSPELVMFSMHLDSLTLITGLKLKIRIAELPPEMVIFHIEHGSGWTPEQDVSMYRRINQAGIRVLSHSSYLRYAENLLHDPRYFLATENWGLAEFDLPEQIVTQCFTAAESVNSELQPKPQATVM
jgi:hypothetical protein